MLAPREQLAPAQLKNKLQRGVESWQKKAAPNCLFMVVTAAFVNETHIEENHSVTTLRNNSDTDLILPRIPRRIQRNSPDG